MSERRHPVRLFLDDGHPEACDYDTSHLFAGLDPVLHPSWVGGTATTERSRPRSRGFARVAAALRRIRDRWRTATMRTAAQPRAAG